MEYGVSSAFEEGVRLLQANDLSAALPRFQQAVQEDPTHAKAYGYLGIVLSRLGRLAEGIRSLQEAARLQPTDAGAHYNLAVALAQAGRIAEAQEALQQTLRIDPTHAQAQAAQHSLASAAPVAAPAPSVSPYEAAPPTGPVPLVPPRPLESTPLPTAAPVAPSLGAATPMPVQGMQYAPTAAPRAQFLAPSAGTRIARGLGWGALYGQWWTVLNLFWAIFYSADRAGDNALFGYVVQGVVFAVVFAIGGSLVGLIIAALDLPVAKGAIVGIVMGLVFLGIDTLMSHNPANLINIFFWFFTGRFVGAGIAARVQQPVQGS